MLASSANQEGQANHARKLYGIPYESEFNAAGIILKVEAPEFLHALAGVHFGCDTPACSAFV
jgi:hypothetical protein